MGIRKIKKLFERCNVIVTGLRGSGKDMLTANVIARRRQKYCSNLDYRCAKSEYIPFRASDIDCGKNSYKNFISGQVNAYRYPHGDGVDIYISDGGVYYPAQYCNELNRDAPYMSTYQALSRQLADANFHVNVQNLNRLWDKIREQSDTYLRCKWCKVFFGKIVIQKVIEYDQYDACLKRVEPLILPKRTFNSKEGKTLVDIEKSRYAQMWGRVKPHICIYWNKSDYDTRVFRKILEGDEKNEEACNNILDSAFGS